MRLELELRNELTKVLMAYEDDDDDDVDNKTEDSDNDFNTFLDFNDIPEREEITADLVKRLDELEKRLWSVEERAYVAVTVFDYHEWPVPYRKMMGLLFTFCDLQVEKECSAIECDELLVCIVEAEKIMMFWEIEVDKLMLMGYSGAKLTFPILEERVRKSALFRARGPTTHIQLDAIAEEILEKCVVDLADMLSKPARSTASYALISKNIDLRLVLDEFREAILRPRIR
ncbi:unnamed protein product [Caenorhabditis bovis]|uniref:Uncharacterized protein n=1 Tax=Caenorhabditis bovis TaxID=2654633 RepID=A0A8S1EHJ6_9PELO|nr:unnamed protein product [Caenorhabditis bovis]